MSNKQLGQYFTTDIILKEKVNEFINNNSKKFKYY